MIMRPLKFFAVAASFVIAFLVVGGVLTARQARGEEVDLQLVLAVDVSLSMDNEEQQLQREAHVRAFREQLVVSAIANGTLGRIAVSYIEWAGDGQQRVVVPWTIVHDEATSQAFAARLEAEPIWRIGRTSISSALNFAAGHFEQSGHTSPRRVIDIMGDGSNNEGPPMVMTRDELISRGITINGLPLVLDRSGTQMLSTNQDPVTLEHYYENCVIGGPGSFQIPIREIGQMFEALRAKLIIEIAGLRVAPLVVPASSPAPFDCNARFSF